MDQSNQWLHELEPEELVYMNKPEDQLDMQQLTEQCYTPPMPNPFHPSQSAHFQSFGSPRPSNLSFGATVKNEPGQSSSSPNILSFGGGLDNRQSFSGAWQEAIEGLQVAEKRSRAPVNAQEHVIAERRRREKLQQQFLALAAVVPGLKKTDKISLLGSTIDYVKLLEEKVKALEERAMRRTAESTVFESKCVISADDAASGGDGGSSSGESGPTVEANIRGNTFLLKIRCKDRRGVLVMVLSELENQGLSILNTNVVPFTASSLNITITAKIEEGFSTAVEFVKNMNMALRSFN